MNTRIDSIFSTLLLILAFSAVYAAMPHKTATEPDSQTVAAARQTPNATEAR